MVTVESKINAGTSSPLTKRTHLAIAVSLLLLIVGNSVSEYVMSIAPQATVDTIPEVVMEFIVQVILVLLIQAPMSTLVWNFILVPIIGLPKIGYWKALGVISAFLWITL